MKEFEWLVTYLPQGKGVTFEKTEIFAAYTCECENGAIVFRGGNNLEVVTVVSPGVWRSVQRTDKINEEG